MSKRILIFHSSNDLYGASKILLQVINQLKKNGSEIHVFLPYKGPLDKLFFDKKIKTKHLNFGVLRRKYFSPTGLLNRVFKIFISTFKIIRYVKKNNIDIIYTNTSIVLASGISAFLCKVPNYVHIHEIPNNNFYSRTIGFFISRFSSKIIVVSKSVKSHWSKYISKPLTLIYNGIPKTNIQRIVKSPTKKIKFLTIARLLPYKGHKYIIEIASNLKKKNINSEFIFLGDTFKGYESYECELKQMSKDLGMEKNILFKGFDSNISKYVNQSDFLLHGAIDPDPLPTVIFEAIQHELPVISTCIGGPVEILDNGNGGLLIPVDDAFMASDEIANYIFNKKLVEKKKRYSTNFIEKEFSEKKFNKKILKFFNE
jgi:glycosyltransferase involved in cell wall biosynthesis